MKVQNRNVDLLHKNIKILQNELAQKNEIIKSFLEIQSTVFDSLSAARNNPRSISNLHHQQHQQSQQLLEQNQQNDAWTAATSISGTSATKSAHSKFKTTTTATATATI